MKSARPDENEPLDLRSVIETIPALVVCALPRESATYVNRAWQEYTGSSPQHSADFTWQRAIHPDDQDRFLGEWSEAVSVGKPFETEARVRSVNGHYRWFRVKRTTAVLRAGKGKPSLATLIAFEDIEERKQAEHAREETQEQWKVAFEDSPTMYFILDSDGVVVSVNKCGAELMGYSKDELLGKPILERFFEFDRQAVEDHFREGFDHPGRTVQWEARKTRKDGTILWVREKGNAVYLKERRVLLIACEDITDQKRAEEAAQRIEKELRDVIQLVPAFVWTATPDGAIDFVNERWQAYTGLRSMDKILGWSWISVLHPDDLVRVGGAWRAAIENREPMEAETRVRGADGEYRWWFCRNAPLRDEFGNIVKWYGIGINIDDRKRAEEAAEMNELAFRRIVETIPALVWCASPDGELTFVNQRILEYTGTAFEDLACSGWVNYLHPDDVEQTLAMWTHAVRTGNPHEIQYRLRKRDGTYRWFHVLGQAMTDDQGSVVQWYGLLIDIDERKNIEEALRRTETRLARATQIATVGELSAAIAHEINQPIGAVVTNAYACLRWLSSEPANLPKAREAAERIVRDGKDTVEVVGRIRALFKRTHVQHERLDLNAVVVEMVRLLGAESIRRRAAIETELEKNLPAILGDRVQIQQLILNLLMNGLDAMDLVADRPKRIVIRTRQKDASTTLVEIEDSGAGLTDCEKVFEPFYTTKDHGMGMGLTICRSIVEGQNGKLWATSNTAFGTTFSFTLPVDTDESKGSQQ